MEYVSKSQDIVDRSCIRSDIVPIAKVRRFGALFEVSPDCVGHQGGLGTQTRVSSSDLYGNPNSKLPTGLEITSVEPRMCHSISAVDTEASLMVGGRSSP